MMQPSEIFENEQLIRYCYSIALVIVTIIITYNRKYIQKIIQYHDEWKHLVSLIHSSSSSVSTTTGSSRSNIQVSGIYIHPIKSLRPVAVQSTRFSPLGLEWDRNLMLVRPRPASSIYSISTTDSSLRNKATHRFLTQRQCPTLATINVSLPTVLPKQNNKIVIQLSHESQKEKLYIDISPDVLQNNPIRYIAGIWDDNVQVCDLGDEAALYIQKIIQCEEDSYDDVRIVSIIPNVTYRKTDERYVPTVANPKFGLASPQTSLQDGYPILITSEESLQELNTRLKKKNRKEIPMSRFRPNIVVKGLDKAFDEDEWKAIQIGGRDGPIFHIVKGCPRCKQSCTDQLTGERDVEPLETLKEFRALGSYDEDVYFGQNVVLQPTLLFSGCRSYNSSRSSTVCVGDEVRLLTRGDPVWDIEKSQLE